MTHYYVFKVRGGDVIYDRTMPDQYHADLRASALGGRSFWSTFLPLRWFY